MNEQKHLSDRVVGETPDLVAVGAAREYFDRESGGWECARKGAVEALAAIILKHTATPNLQSIVSELANLPLIVPGSHDEVFKRLRRLQERADTISRAAKATQSTPRTYW